MKHPDGLERVLANQRAYRAEETMGDNCCPMCDPTKSTFKDPIREFCDKHLRQYLRTFNINPDDLAVYRASTIRPTEIEALRARVGELEAALQFRPVASETFSYQAHGYADGWTAAIRQFEQNALEVLKGKTHART